MARKPDDWMPLVIGRYLANTAHLTRDQHGAYLLLLMAYWTNGGPIDANDGELAATARAAPAEWKKLRPIIAKFFVERDGKWHQKKADEELAKAKKLTEAKSKAGKKGAAKTWESHNSANGTEMAEPSDSHRQTDAPIPIPRTITKSLLSNFIVGKGGPREPMPDHNKIALFQKWLADKIGPTGWMIVGAAADPAHVGHAKALKFCIETAAQHGKGWPLKWPAAVCA